MKTVGIIGGLGPITTSEFYIDLNYIFRNNKKIKHKPSIVIANVPLPYQIEREALLTSEGIERYIPYLQQEAKRLEAAKADFLVMPCNSMHIYIDIIREAVKIPMLSIIEETVNFIQGKQLRNVGIISTAMTLRYKLYETELERNKINFIVPDLKEQSSLNKMILNLVNGKKSGTDQTKLNRIIDRMYQQGVDGVVLGCTDLQILEPRHKIVPIYDSMKILLEATADYMV